MNYGHCIVLVIKQIVTVTDFMTFCGSQKAKVKSSRLESKPIFCNGCFCQKTKRQFLVKKKSVNCDHMTAGRCKCHKCGLVTECPQSSCGCGVGGVYGICWNFESGLLVWELLN